MADNINSENINEYIKSHSQKIKRLENNSSTKTVNELPTNSQGDNGDIYIVKDKNRSYLVFKSNNVWNEVSSDLLIRGTQNTGQSNNQSDTIDGYDHDSGWIDATDSNDSDTLGTPVNPKGIYRITHNMGATLLSGEVFCRFEALNNGQVRTYTINLNSSSSYPGPNANRYGYWIEIIDSNNVDLHVYPDGLGILYSDRFKDSSNTSVLLSSNDTQNIASLEVRVFLKKIVNNKGKKPLLHYSNPKKNPFSGKRKNGKVLGKSVVGDKGASVDGTKNSSFKIDSDGTGVLLKNDSGVLKVRNIADDGDVQINASKLVVSAQAAATNEIGKSDVSDKFLSTHDGSALYNTLMMNSSGVVENSPAGGNVIFVDDRFLFADNADNTKTCFFQLSGITSGAGRTMTIPDADGTIALTSDVVTNHITNNAADVMTVSDFGANAALKIDADQPDTAGAENSIGLQIDYDRAVATSGTANHNDKGIDLDVNTATLGIGAAWGIDIDVVGATSGTHTVKGVDIKVSGADKNHGLDITAPDGADDYHIKLIALDDTNDYATISLADTADLTIATVGTGTRDSDITLDADGKILLESAAGGVYVAEAGNASADSDAYGQLWVKSDTPNNLYFTDDTGQDIPLTNNGKARTWTNTSGGYKTNNNSSTVYYFQYYPNYHSWGNGDSSPTGLTYTDSYSYQWCATSPGVLTNISVTLRAFDTGLTDPVKFYVYKGVPANGATSTVLTLIGTTGTITPIASRQMALSTDISSSNDFAAGDKLWVMYKKDSTSGNQDLYFAVTISGEYT